MSHGLRNYQPSLICTTSLVILAIFLLTVWNFEYLSQVTRLSLVIGQDAVSRPGNRSGAQNGDCRCDCNGKSPTILVEAIKEQSPEFDFDPKSPLASASAANETAANVSPTPLPLATEAISSLPTNSRSDVSVSVTPSSATLLEPSASSCHNETPAVAIAIKTLQSALKHFVRAHRFSKGGKVAQELREGISLLSGLIHHTLDSGADEITPGTENIKGQPVIDGSQGENASELAVDVCPEVWRDPNKYGYPYFYDNWQTTNCTNAQPFASVISILVDAATPGGSDKHLQQIIADLSVSYSDVPVIMALRTDNSDGLPEFAELAGINLTTVVVNASSHDTEGKIWRSLISKAQTKYVLIARKLTRFLPDARLERLVRLLNYTGADVVGGAFRNELGQWQMGCYQAAMRNYAFKLVAGYDVSYNSCVYCDVIGGPFVARSDYILKFMDERFSGESLFANAFALMRYRNEEVSIMVCPDSMFFTSSLNISASPRGSWLPFAIEWELNDIILPNHQKHVFDCDETKQTCQWLKGIAMPICCLRELSKMVQLIMTVCEGFEHGGCEIEAGSTIGAVKFNGNLPWERDADLNWMAANYDKLLNSTDLFAQHGFTLAENSGGVKIRECWRNTTDVNCGYFGLHTKSWRIEMWGVTYLSNVYFERFNVSVVTKVEYDGAWVNVYPNPAFFARNLYGDDVFEHVEHWITLGKSTGWSPYQTGKWLECPRPKFHACLDQYLPTGNLQFLDIYV